MEEGHGRPQGGLTVSRNTFDRWALRTAIALSVVAYGGLVRLDTVAGTLRDGFVSQTIGWWLLAWVGFGLAVWRNEREPIPPAVVWGAAIGFRVALWFTEPTLSDDVYRYLWDGHLLTSGINPYSHVVAAPELDAMTIPIRALVNNPALSTPYLPAAQLLFGLVALIAPLQSLSMQMVMTAFDLTAAWLIVRLLTVVGLPRRRVLLYLWNPLVIVEIAHSAHLDAFTIAAAVAAVVTLRSPTGADVTDTADTADTAVNNTRNGRFPIRGSIVWLWSPLLLAVATLTRPLPVFLLVVVWWRWNWPQRLVFGAASALPVGLFAIGAGLGLGTPLTGTGVFGSARIYTEQWEFNALVFNEAREALTTFGLNDPGQATRQILGAALAVVVLVAWIATGRRDRRAGSVDRTDLRMIATVLAAYIVLGTTFHPWYLLILVALLPFSAPGAEEPSSRWLLVLPWLYLAAAASFSYLTYVDPLAHAERAWVRQLEWYPTLAAAVLGWWAVKRRTRRGPRQVSSPGSTTIESDGQAATRSSALPG